MATDVKKTNTAKFVSYPDLQSTSPIERTKDYDIFVVQPNPSIKKTANPTSVTSTATDITYTVDRQDAARHRPPLHDVTIIDCVPDTLTVTQANVNNGGVLGNTPGCGTTVSITWTFDPLTPGVDKVVTYVANIKPGSPADVKFKNTVGMSGTSLPDDVTGERTYLTGANADVFITGASIDKSVTPFGSDHRRDRDLHDRHQTAGCHLPEPCRARHPAAVHRLRRRLGHHPRVLHHGQRATRTPWRAPQASRRHSSSPEPASPGATGQQIGWSFDPLPNQDQHRIIRITYKSRVSNLPQNVAGVTRTNTASAGYGYASKPTTLAAAQNPPKPIGSKGATITLTEPNLKILKRVNLDASITALPDDTFEYLVNVSNPQRAGGVPTSTAYDVKVRDCVPDGISVVNAGAGLLTTDDSCNTTDKVVHHLDHHRLAGGRWSR